MSDSPAVTASVIVPTHGGAHRLPALLETLAAQTGVARYEVVVVVDGVVDDTPALLDRWRQQLPLVVVTHPEAQGVAAALTSGFDVAAGTYLIRCDDDLAIPTDFIAGHLAAQGGSTSRVVLALTRDIFADTAYARAYGRRANERALAAYYAQTPELRWQHLAACFSIHREAWAASGGFDPSFPYGEDSEFGYRLWRLGYDFVIEPALEVGHRGPASSAAIRVPRSYVSGASRRRFLHVHPDAPQPVASASDARARVWSASVQAVAATVRGYQGYRALGSSIAWLVERLPSRIGGLMVALGVEAAARAGRRFGSIDLHAYRDQKSRELGQEVDQGGTGAG